MARLTVDGPDLVVGLSWLEKLGAAHRNIRIPLRAIRSAAVEPHPWDALRGIKLAGTGIPEVAVLGTRYSSGGRDFAALVGHRPAVRVELSDEAPYAQLLVSVSDAESTLAAIPGTTGI